MQTNINKLFALKGDRYSFREHTILSHLLAYEVMID